MEEQPWENVSYGDTVSLFGTASSGLSPSFTVLDGSATIEGDQLTVTGAGKITLSASQEGDANFLPAGPVQIEFIAEKAILTVTADDAERGFQDPNPSFTLSILDLSLLIRWLILMLSLLRLLIQVLNLAITLSLQVVDPTATITFLFGMGRLLSTNYAAKQLPFPKFLIFSTVTLQTS